jgi:hypothetical protein
MGASDTPTDAEILRLAAKAALGGVRVCIPAVVVAYDRAAQTITAQVVVRSRYLDENGQPVTYLPKPIPNVPVQFPAGGGGSLTFDLEAGDPVTLLVADRSLDEWKTTGQEDNTPAHPRRFDLTDAIALPGGQSPATPLPGAAVADGAAVLRGSPVKLGAGTATERVILGDAFFADLQPALAELAAISAVGIPTTNVIALLTAITTALTPVGAPYLSTVVKTT